MQNLSETVPAALRAELARRGIRKGAFAQQIGHDETWLYRRLTCRAEFTLSDLDLMCRELLIDPVELMCAATAIPTEETGAGRVPGRHPTPTPANERTGQ